MSLGSPPFPSWDPHFNSRFSVIAPFWADIDLSFTDGVVYFNHILRSSAEEVVAPRAAELFDEAKFLVLSGAGDAGFLPTEVVTVTWQNVSPYPAYYYSSQVCTFHAILFFYLVAVKAVVCNFVNQNFWL